MKMLRTAVMVIAMQISSIVGSVALASAGSEHAPPDPRTLGIEEARVNYCTKADSVDAPRLALKVHRLTEGVRAEALGVVRNSAEYRKGYDSEMQFIAQVDDRNATRFCANKTSRKD